jgi:hypothetical protein
LGRELELELRRELELEFEVEAPLELEARLPPPDRMEQCADEARTVAWVLPQTLQMCRNTGVEGVQTRWGVHSDPILVVLVLVVFLVDRRLEHGALAGSFLDLFASI